MLPIIYASTSGNVAAVCERVGEVLYRHKHPVKLYRVELTPIEVLGDSETTIMATSTWEHGIINPYFDTFLAQMKQLDLHGQRAAFIGLGDVRYEPRKFCAGMDQLRELFLQQGGTEIYRPLKLNGEPYQYLDSVVTEWAEAVHQGLVETNINSKK